MDFGVAKACGIVSKASNRNGEFLRMIIVSADCSWQCRIRSGQQSAQN